MKHGDDRSCGTLLRRQREERGWSLQELVRQLGELSRQENEGPCPLTISMVGKWERDEHLPSPTYRKLFCLLYQCPATALGFLPARSPASDAEGQRVCAPPVRTPFSPSLTPTPSENTCHREPVLPGAGQRMTDSQASNVMRETATSEENVPDLAALSSWVGAILADLIRICEQVQALILCLETSGSPGNQGDRCLREGHVAPTVREWTGRSDASQTGAEEAMPQSYG